jgi:hypothetical protein
MSTLVTYLPVIWASPMTLLGLVLIYLDGGRRLRRVAPIGVFEYLAEPVGSFYWFFTRYGFGAITLGGVIIYKSNQSASDSQLHEFVHVRQTQLLGIFFPVAYGLASLWAALRYGWGMMYKMNVFEIMAREQSSL